MMTKTQKLTNEFAKREHEHTIELDRTIRQEFPVGRRVSWEHGTRGPIQFGHVTGYGYGSSIFVRNERSKTERKLAAYELELA